MQIPDENDIRDVGKVVEGNKNKSEPPLHNS